MGKEGRKWDGRKDVWGCVYTGLSIIAGVGKKKKKNRGNIESGRIDFA